MICDQQGKYGSAIGSWGWQNYKVVYAGVNHSDFGLALAIVLPIQTPRMLLQFGQ